MDLWEGCYNTGCKSDAQTQFWIKNIRILLYLYKNIFSGGEHVAFYPPKEFHF